jgi:hypothetical protein
MGDDTFLTKIVHWRNYLDAGSDSIPETAS